MRRNQAVAVDQGKIVGFNWKTSAYPAHASVINATGKTLLPGLIDASESLSRAAGERQAHAISIASFATREPFVPTGLDRPESLR